MHTVPIVDIILHVLCNSNYSKRRKVYDVVMAIISAPVNGVLIPNNLVQLLARDKTSEMQMASAKW